MKEINHELLKEAFSCNTSGNGKCYYNAEIEGIKYEGGIRNWDLRWKLIKSYPILYFKNKKILDIGCNMGIFLSYVKRFEEASEVVGVDEYDEMLISSNKKDTIKSAKLLAKAFDIDYKIIQLDLNKDNYEEMIGYDFDIVSVMSIYKWVEDGERFLKYLSNFKEILYEGHDSDIIEENRFKQLGFKCKNLGKSQTGTVYSEQDSRTLFYFYKW